MITALPALVPRARQSEEVESKPAFSPVRSKDPDAKDPCCGERGPQAESPKDKKDNCFFIDAYLGRVNVQRCSRGLKGIKMGPDAETDIEHEGGRMKFPSEPGVSGED